MKEKVKSALLAAAALMAINTTAVNVDVTGTVDNAYGFGFGNATSMTS